MRAGFDVYDSLSGSEVLHLLEHRVVDAVVIAASIEDRDLEEIRRKAITVQLAQGSTIQDVAWELALLFGKTGAIQ